MKVSLLADLVEDSLSEVTYDADLAGLAYAVNNGIEGLYVSTSGYNDKLDGLLKIVLDKLRGLVVSPDRLRVIVEKVSERHR